MQSDRMPDFTIGLALYDFLPVGLTGVALWFIARLVQAQDAPSWGLALVGSGLILAGGLAKASWKLIAAATGTDIGWLSNALFPLMAPGFALLAAAVWAGTRGLHRRQPLRAWPLALLIVLLAFALSAARQWMLEIPRGWFLPLLTLASVGNLATSLLLIGAGVHLRRMGIVLLFAVNLVMILGLQPIAMVAPRTLAMHWIEQTLTTLGTGCFALAAYLLWRAATSAGTRTRTG